MGGGSGNGEGEKGGLQEINFRKIEKRFEQSFI